MPPSASARAGTSQLAAHAGWYVNTAPPTAPPTRPPAAKPYCRAFSESDSRAEPTRRADDAHSSCDASTRRASTPLEPLPTRHRTVDASRTAPTSHAGPATPAAAPAPATATATATRVPPRSGPTGGDTPAGVTEPW